MKDHAQEVRWLLTDARQLVDALGWLAKSKHNSGGLLIRCPAHEDREPSCGVTKGPDGTLRAKCHACGWTADALGMIAHCHNLSTSSADDFREVLAIGARIGGDLRLEDEIRDGRQSSGDIQRKPVAQPDPEPPREYPPIAEVGQLWSRGLPVEVDADASDYLRGRSIDPVVVARMGLGHALRQGCDLPAWATCKAGTWSLAGYRLLVRAWDSNGKMRSVRAWQVDGLEGPKRLPPSGHKQAGLVQANAHGVRMLLGQAPAGRVLICEGEPDWMTWATRVPADVAVFGIGSGSWTPEHAGKVPKGSEVLILTHRDPAGHKYAKAVAETLTDRTQVWRLDGESGPDENDRAQRLELPNDPRTGCIPWNEAARKVAEEEPRCFTVKEMLAVVHKRITSKEDPVMWTTGHWKVDLMTGGLRPQSGWVVGGASSWGKSSFIVALADENMRGWRNPTVPLIVSAEDSEETYGERLLARRARVNALRLRDNCLRPDEHQRVCAVLAKAEPKPHYLDARGVLFERLLRQISGMVKEHGIQIVILDYIQECRTKQKYESERVMFREIAKTFRHSMKRLGVASVILTQLTNPEPGKAPTKDHIRECKDIGHGAEVVALGWETAADVTGANGELYPAQSKFLMLDKTKSGRKGAVSLEWDSVSACFNRVLRPAYATEEDKWYEAEADKSQSMSMPDDIDNAIESYNDHGRW